MQAKANAFIRRDFQTQSSYRLGFFMQLGSMIVSISIFYFISQILGTAISPYLSRYGTDYFHFALMGIAFVPFIRLSTSSLADVIHEYQHSGTLEMLFVSPTPFLSALIMSTLWNYYWAFGQMLFYLAMAGLIFQADLNWASIPAAIVVVIFTIFANAGLGFINASFVLVTKRTSPLASVLSMFTTLLAGVYYPVDVLPEWLRRFSYLLPATYAFDALRQTMLLGASLADIWLDLLALTLFIIFLLPLGLFIFTRGIRWAKMDGSLSQY